MRDERAQQRVTSEQRFEVLPGERLATGAAVQPLLPDAAHTTVELPQTAVVRRTAVILVVPSQPGVERLTLFGDRFVPVALAPRRDALEPSALALAHRANMNGESPVAAACPDMGEAQEVERRRLTFPASARMGRCIATKLDDPRLLGVKLQTLAGKPLMQYLQHTLRVLPILKTDLMLLAFCHAAINQSLLDSASDASADFWRFGPKTPSNEAATALWQ
jgi:hypothetical protein